ncbi:glycosyltransferase [Streptomyces sp. NPDC094034]|uniref:glycosyltransferase n=1 Tax=Streptomyces sp. NPDC094034 TaxID=3155309 RepID=UPI00331E1963
MRVLQVVGPHIELPTGAYGGSERIVESLAVEMPSLGVEMTTFSVGTTTLPGDVAFHFDTAQTTWDRFDDVIQAGKAFAMAQDFDVIHYHDVFGTPFASLSPVPFVTTLHSYAAGGNPLEKFVDAFPDANYVTISASQRSLCSHLRVVATVPNCIPEDVVHEDVRSGTGGSYLVHLGRMCADKGTDLAVRLAREAGIPLVLAGPVFSPDVEFFAREIKPHIDGAAVTYIESVAGADKVQLLRGALAMVSPGRWNEPFGLSMVEAMALGTPVVASRAGSLPEVVDDGVTGFVADDVPAMLACLDRVRVLDRGRCAATARERFSPRVMAANYLEVYRRLVG